MGAAKEAFEQARGLALSLPGVVASTSYGTPAFKLEGKLLARLHQTEEALVVRADLIHRDILMETAPRVFYITDHYANWPWVLVRLATVSRAQLARVLQEAWHEVSGELPRKPRASARKRR